MTVLTRRALNRATLERQHLLARSTLGVEAMVERIVGLQAQTTHSWYVGLWNRIEGLAPEDVSAELEARRLVRLSLMRSTIHLVTADDALTVRPALVPMLTRAFTSSRHAREVDGIDRSALAAAGRAVLAKEPLTLRVLGEQLAVRWPGHDPAALGQAIRADEALVQVTPRGLWRRSGPAAHTTLQTWLGREPDTSLTLDALVLRYLAAFGPASVKDAQAWSGLTRLSEVFDRLRPDLLVATDENGRELFDLPDAPRPDPDVDAPVRLLYEFDNLLLAYDDRSRVTTELHRGVASVANGLPPAAVLVDGVTAGTWRIERAKGTATLTVRPHTRFTSRVAAAIESEGAALLGFTDSDATAHDVVVHRTTV